jgi:serine phosphatase RsbU (regulator of sigma subunit)
MKSDILRQIPLFANLPVEEINRLAGSLLEEQVQAGAVLLEEGSLSSSFYLICEGEVEIIRSLGSEDERVVALSRPGAVLGEMSMFNQDGRHSASARARTPARLLRITFEQFDALLHRRPALANDLLRLYSRRLVESESQTIQDLREKNRQLTLAYQELQAAQAAMIEKEKLEHELQLAAQLQRSILPEKLPAYPGLDFGALMIPARRVGGDFYDLIPLDGDRVGIVVGDVCDKGMPAALFMTLSYSTTRQEAYRQASPGSALREVNRRLVEINRMNMFVTLLYGILDCRTGRFRYARAGHPAPLVLDGLRQPVGVPYGWGMPIGLFDGSPIDEQEIQIPPGGAMLIYSDGLSDAVEAQKDGPDLPRLCSDLLARDGRGAQDLCDELWNRVCLAVNEATMRDDFTVVALKRTAPAGSTNH